MKILFIRYSSLGDAIYTTGVIRYFKRNFPTFEVHVITKEQFQDIYFHCPSVDFVHSISNKGSISEINELKNQMPTFDYIVDLHNKLRSLYTLFRIKGKKRARVNNNSILRRRYIKSKKCYKSLKKHIVEKQLIAIQKIFPIPKTPSNELRPYLEPSIKYDIQKHNDVLREGAMKVALHIFGSTKMKSVEIISSKLLESLKEYDIFLVGVGDEGSIDTKNHKNCVNLINKTNIPELISVISQVDYVISTDSAVAAMGIALDKPTVDIFTCTDPTYLGFNPLKFENTKVIKARDLPCRPCTATGTNVCKEQHKKCILNINTSVFKGIHKEFE